jgi:hypothetical protein
MQAAQLRALLLRATLLLRLRLLLRTQALLLRTQVLLLRTLRLRLLLRLRAQASKLLYRVRLWAKTTLADPGDRLA